MSTSLRQYPSDDELESEYDELEHGSTPEGEDETGELEDAMRLLEFTNEAELEGFIGGLLQKASQAMGSSLPATVLRPLTGTLRVALRQALPVVGAGGRTALSRRHHDAGHRLAAAASNLFGLELEGLSPEDQEFELARRFVRLARAVGRRGSRLARRLPPRAAVRRTLVTAARRHAPGLLRRGARLMVPVTFVVQDPPPEEPPSVNDPAPADASVSDGEPPLDQDPSSIGAADPVEPEPEPATTESAAPQHVCHCGGHCAHCRAHATGRWVRRGRLLILQDV